MYIEKLTNDLGSVYYTLFERGQFQGPVAVLTESQMESLFFQF